MAPTREPTNQSDIMNINLLLKEITNTVEQSPTRTLCDDALVEKFTTWKQAGIIKDRGWQWKMYAGESVVLVEIWTTRTSHDGPPNCIHMAACGKKEPIYSVNELPEENHDDAYDRAMTII